MRDTLNSVIHWVNHAGALHWDFASAMFVQIVALVVVLALMELCLRRRVRAVVRYWLWALVILKLMLPVTLRTPASVAYWIVQEPVPARVATAATPPATEIRLTPFAIVTDSQQPTHAESEPLEVAANPDITMKAIVLPLPQPSPVRLDTQATPIAVTAPKELATLTGSGWLLIAWCSGCFLLGVVVVRRAGKVWRLARRTAEAPRQLHERLQAACELLNLSASRIRLRISEEVGCPAICGFWRPTILVPRRLVNELDDEQFQLIFVHELFHWQRWDVQLNLLQTLLQIVYFYNPAVWIANAVLRRLREEAVDDAVLLAAGIPQERYSNTLLDVAAQSLRPVEMSVRLIGILESRKALARRIRRLATGPLPRSARLGLWGFVAVALFGLALLPMAGSRRAVADKAAEKSAEKPAGETSTKTTAANQETTSAPIAALSGRITDENGKPVSDATIQLVNTSNHAIQETATDRDGRYVVERPWFPGEHRFQIYSDRCLGFAGFSDSPRVVLDSKNPIVRDFTLKIACQVRVQTLDEAGHPIQGVALFRAGQTNPYQEPTDRQGWMTIGGLVPGEHVFAFRTDSFVIDRLTVKIESPRTVVERKLVLKRGAATRGTVVCSDGKPAAGWRVVALPSWWSFNSVPLGEVIKGDGSFVLPHIGPGTYDVTVVTPSDRSSSGNSLLLGNVDLLNHQGPLILPMDAPSPDSMVMIQGHLRFVGGRPKQYMWIAASSSDGRIFRSDANVGPGSDTFRVGPVPRGKYSLIFDSPEIETKQLDAVIAPVDDLKVEIQVHDAFVLHGFVGVTGAKGFKPVGDFLIRVIKLQNLRGTNFTPSERWRRVYDSQGEFSEQAVGPGIYVVEATADGFATARSEPINTDHLPQNGIRLALRKGGSVVGTVVDEEGRPIDGAVVMSLTKSGGQLPMSANQNPDEIGVRTVAGRFQFDGLSPGRDSFQVMHPAYALATVHNVEVRPQGQEALAIVLKRGGTIAGHVQDEHGRLLSGVALHFRRIPGHFAGERYNNEFATAVTDASGYYEVHHLPEELIHIMRDRGERSLGVFHQAVLPLNGKTRTVDFGGGPTISGRLFVNGAPLASTKLLLADEQASGDDFGASTITHSDGSFAFAGVPPGNRYLYFAVGKRRGGSDDWVRVRALEINTAARNFGRIDHRTGTVTVKVAGRPKDDVTVALRYYDPGLIQVSAAAQSQFPRTQDAPIVFENVGPGTYDINVSADNQPLHIRRMLIVSPDNANPIVTVEWPHGTASIRGTIDQTLREMLGNGFIALSSPDFRWLAPVRVNEEGHFELDGIPAGDCSMTMLRFRRGGFIPLTLKGVRLAAGEVKTLDLRKEAIPQAELLKEALKVSVFTPQGFPLPGCEIRLTGASGELKPTRSQAGRVWFAVQPGTYQLSCAYPGAPTVTQTVEIKPTSGGGTASMADHLLNLTLAPAE